MKYSKEIPMWRRLWSHIVVGYYKMMSAYHGWQLRRTAKRLGINVRK